MGLLDAFKKKSSEIIRDNKGNVTGTTRIDTDISKYLGIFDSRVRNSNYITLFSEIEEIQFPIRAIIERALKAEFVLKNYDSDEPEYYNTQINKFLTQPNEADTFHEFLSKIIAYYLVTGNAYIHSAAYFGGNERWKPVDNYYVLPSDKTRVIYQDRPKLFQGATMEEIIKEYRLSTGIMDIKFDPESILNFHDLKLSFDGHILEGRSRLDALKYPISNVIAAYEARNAIFVKRGALGMIVSRKADEAGSVPLRESEKKNLQNSWQKYGITGGRDAIAISDVPVDFINFGVSIRELEPFRETLEDAKTIAGAFGVPDHLVPGNDKATYNNVSTVEKAIYQNTVIPLTNRIIGALNSWLGLSSKWEKGGMYLEADFSKIECLQEDKKFSAEVQRIKSETAIKQYKEGFITYNQALVDMGKEAIPGGDYLIWDDRKRNRVQQTQNQNNTQNQNKE